MCTCNSESGIRGLRLLIAPWFAQNINSLSVVFSKLDSSGTHTGLYHFFSLWQSLGTMPSSNTGLVCKKFILSTLLRSMQSNHYASRHSKKMPSSLIPQQCYLSLRRKDRPRTSGYPCFVLYRFVGCRRRFVRRSRGNCRTIGSHPFGSLMPQHRHLGA